MVGGDLVTIEEAQANEDWKRQTFIVGQVEHIQFDPDPRSYFCHALVYERSRYRRCRSWTYATRGGRPVCPSHYRSLEITWEKA